MAIIHDGQEMNNLFLFITSIEPNIDRILAKVSFFFFLIQNSFLFSTNDKTQKTCTLKTNHFLVSQGNGEKGARYLDPKYSRWLSVDPALGEYMSGSDAGCGGAYNPVNMSLYHYGGNNPIKYVDPDGRIGIPYLDQKIKEEKTPVAGKVDGQKKYGKVSDDLIGLLKRIETPKPDKDGKIGLHKPGDRTVTYGYGEVLKGKTEITDELKAQYPPMTEEEATRRLIEKVLPEYETYVSNKLFNRNMTATQQEFDAYVLDEYNTDSGPLMNKIKNSNDKSNSAITKIFKEHKITFPGLPKRREAEAKVYTEGDYSEDFSW